MIFGFVHIIQKMTHLKQRKGHCPTVEDKKMWSNLVF